MSLYSRSLYRTLPHPTYSSVDGTLGSRGATTIDPSSNLAVSPVLGPPVLMSDPVSAHCSPKRGFEHYEYEIDSPRKRKIVVISERPDSPSAQEYTAAYATSRILTSLAKKRTGWMLALQRGLCVPAGLRRAMRRALSENVVDLPSLFDGYEAVLAEGQHSLHDLIVALCTANLAWLGESARYLSMPAEEYVARLSAYQLRDFGVATVSPDYAIIAFSSYMRRGTPIEEMTAHANLLRSRAFAKASELVRMQLVGLVAGEVPNLFVRVDSLYLELFRKEAIKEREARLAVSVDAVRLGLALRNR